MIDAQTCLEKIGIKERNGSLNENKYNSWNNEYDAKNPNALSDGDNNGKGSGSGGHLYYRESLDKPKVNVNEMNYSNFNTNPTRGVHIGSKTDIDKRYELELTKRYNKDTYVYSDRNPDSISNGTVLGKGTALYLDTLNGGGAYDVEARNAHLMRNEWKRDLQYSKQLVNAEYLIQSEFKVSSYEEQLIEAKNNKEAKAIEKANKKAEKKKAKEERTQMKNMVKTLYNEKKNPTIVPAKIQTETPRIELPEKIDFSALKSLH
jgi:hypothetical protein